MIKRVMHELGKVYDFFFFKSSYNLGLEQENQLPPLSRKKIGFSPRFESEQELFYIPISMQCYHQTYFSQ